MTIQTSVETLTFTRTLRAPAAEVYRAFTVRDGLYYWFCEDANTRPEVGGHALFSWNTGYHAFGVFRELEQDKKIVLSWRGAGETSDSQISITLEAKYGTTELTLEISDFNPEAEQILQREWSTRLNVLQGYLENGEDRRITERIILGIYPGGLNDEIVTRLGFPVKEGALVGGVIDGLGAAKAGLLANDLIVEVNGMAINDGNSIGAALQGRKPGDEVGVTFYRGADKHNVTMPLSGYPVPPMPESAAALADRIEAAYGEVYREIAALLTGHSEEITHKAPAEGEWSACDVVAHLILHERWMQHWTGSLMQGPEVQGYTSNAPARIAGVVKANPTTADILAALKRAHTELVAIVRSVPDTFNTRKSNLWWLSFEVDGAVLHARGHLDQIRRAIEAAKSA